MKKRNSDEQASENRWGVRSRKYPELWWCGFGSSGDGGLGPKAEAQRYTIQRAAKIAQVFGRRKWEPARLD